MRKKIELLVLLLALAGIYTVSRNLEKYVQSDQVKSEQERKMDLVVIDSGHGGSDPGKVGINEVLEKDINLKISKQVEKELKNKGYQVVMTREKDQMLAGETSGNSKLSRRGNTWCTGILLFPFSRRAYSGKADAAGASWRGQ